MAAERQPRIWLLLPVLMALVALTYLPVWDGGLLWDDNHHLTAPALQSLHGLWRIWTELGATQQYYPVAHSAFWIEHQLWGDALVGYHAANIVLHATAAFLLVLILRRLRIPGAVPAAVVFALHPVNVESVAWMSEQKNTLSTVFYLAAALAYLRFDVERTGGKYALALLLFFLALLTKSVTATLPVTLLIVFWWRSGRIDAKHDVLPLAPFVAGGLAAGLFTAWIERTYIGAQGIEFHLSLADRVLVAGRAFWFYLAKLFWPSGLVFIYPRWHVGPPASAQLLYPVAAVALLAGCWFARRRSRAPLAAVLAFAAALVPALGFVDVFPFRYSFVADHFQYLATIPVIALVCAAAVTLLRGMGVAAATAGLATAIALGAPLAVAADVHSRDFTSAELLYRTVLDRNPDAWMAHTNLATILMADGRVPEARAHFLEAVRLEPDVAETQMNAGRVLIEEGQLEAGIGHLRDGIRLGADPADAHSNIGVALLRSGDPRAAVGEFEQALRASPSHPEATINLAAAHEQIGVSAARAGRLPEATAEFEGAVRYAPADAGARYNLGMAYLATGRPRDAIAQLREALRLNPALAQAQAALAAAERGADLR